MEPALGSVFRCDFNQPVIVGVAHAIVPWQGDEVLAIGDRLEYSGQPNCQTPLTPCDDTGITSYDAHGWWVGEGSANDLVIAGNSGYRFWASDGQAMPEIVETPGWSVAGGWLRESSGEVCYDNAAVYIGYIPDTPGYQSSFGQGTTYPIQPAIVLSDETDPDEMPSSHAATAIRADDPSKSPIDWVACGSRFGNRDYGFIWGGRDDGEGGVEWCGRNVNDPDVGWRASDSLQVTAVHDILADGVGIGVAPGDGSTQRLVVLTSVGDINCDFVVDGADLGIVLGQWSGSYVSNPWRTADLNRDGYVDGADLGALLSVWTGGADVHVFVGCVDWQTIEPFDLEGALQLLGFGGSQELGEYCLSLPLEEAVEVAEYVEFVARAIATEESE